METNLRKAQDSLAIEDVYLIDWSARTHSDFDPLLTPPDQPNGLTVQLLCSPEQHIGLITGQTESGPESRVRYSIRTGIRMLKPGTEDSAQVIPEESIFAEINGTFAVRYLIKGSDRPTQEMLEAFADNVIHHVWPYWREFVQATAARLRIPPVMIPMRVVRPGAKKEPTQQVAETASSPAHRGRKKR